MLFQPEDDDEQEDAEGHLPTRHVDRNLQTVLTSEQLQRKLLKLYYDARTFEEGLDEETVLRDLAQRRLGLNPPPLVGTIEPVVRANFHHKEPGNESAYGHTQRAPEETTQKASR